VWVEETPGRSVQRFTLWIGRVDGSRPRLLEQGRDPRISPDGRWIAYSHEEHTYIVSSAGGSSWLVARNAQSVRWSRTSRYLATVAQGRAAVRHRRYDATACDDRSRRDDPRREHLAFGEGNLVGEKTRKDPPSKAASISSGLVSMDLSGFA
jgi:hypothetical protein